MRSILLLFNCLSLALSAQIPDTLVHELAAPFPTNTQLAVAVLDGDAVAYYGYTMTDAGLVAVDNQNRLFEIGSITKIMTSHLLAQAVEEGLVDLQKPIRRYLGYKLKGNPKITPLQLSNHTAGLPRVPENLMPLIFQNAANPYRDYTLDLLQTYLTKELTLDHAPGEKMAYSNLGVGLLGQVLSQVWKQPYPVLLETRLFQPLGLTQTYARLDKAPKEQLVQGQDAYGQPTANWEFDALAPAGCVISSVKDMSRYAQAHLDAKNPITSSMQTVTHTANETVQIGLGWFILKGKEAHRYLFHNGGTGGYTCAMVLNKETQKGVVVLSNVSAMHQKRGNVDQIAIQLLNDLH